MKLKHVLRKLAIPVLLALPAGVPAANADVYPAKLITIVVPFPGGGGTDIVARKVAQKLEEKFKQSVIVDNKPGANTIIGAQHVAKSPPDGYTLLFTTAGTTLQNPWLYKKLPYDQEKDFTPIIEYVGAPVALVVREDLPVNSVKELMAYLAANPGQASYATWGIGSTGHILSEVLNQSAGIKIPHAPYKGEAPALIDLMGGRVTYMLCSMASAVNFSKQGKLKVLAITGTKRVATLPNVPTMQEAGVKGLEPVGWYAFFGPAKLSAPVVDKLAQALKETLQDREIIELINTLGYTPAGLTGNAFHQALREEGQIWKKYIQDNDISLDN